MRRYESQVVGRYVQEALRRAKIESALHQKMSSFAQLTPWVCAIDWAVWFDGVY